MNVDLAVPIALVFVSVALAAGTLASYILQRNMSVRRRLQPATAHAAPPSEGFFDQLLGLVRPGAQPAGLAKARQGASSKVTRLQRRLEMVGWRDPETAALFSLAEKPAPPPSCARPRPPLSAPSA